MKKKLYLNAVISIIYQICTVVIGLILPRLYLQSYGSSVNGLLTSITQMLSIIFLLDLGVGAVVQSALYKPLHEGDQEKINNIYSSAKKYFKLIVVALLVYILVLCLYYGIGKSQDYSWVYTSTLILAMSVSYLAQYYYGICDTLLLNADQKIYIVTIANMIGLFANAIVTIWLMLSGASVQVVKIVAAGVFLIKPFMLHMYVKKNYHIRLVKNPPVDSIPNKWSGLAQHVAVVITNSVDTVVLTLFSTFSSLSVYHVYVMPLNSVRTLIEVTSNSYKSFFGNIIAQKDEKKLGDEFERYETFMHFAIVVVFAAILVCLVPFVLVYTSGIYDANYKDELFGYVITCAYAMFSLRIIYTNVIFAAGKFRETQSYCVIECVINILLSFALVKPLGLTGVAIGTLISSGYRMFVSAYYLQKDVLYRPIRYFIKHVVVDLICVMAMLGIARVLCFTGSTFIAWLGFGFISFVLSLAVCIVIHLVFYQKDMMGVLQKMMRR